MKKLFLLSALLIFACSSDLFAQDYMKMRKKQLRIEHQKKLKLIDSLSQELNLSNKKNLKIKSDSKLAKSQFEEKLLDYKNKSEQLNFYNSTVQRPSPKRATSNRVFGIRAEKVGFSARFAITHAPCVPA